MNRQDAKDAKTTEPSKELEMLASRVIGAAIQVHRTLGPGFLEAVYEEALCIELPYLGIPFERQHPIRLHCRGQIIGEGRVDLLVDGLLVLELKAVETLLPIHTAQLISYLKATRRQLGLLMNFNVPLLADGLRRVVYSHG